MKQQNRSALRKVTLTKATLQKPTQERASPTLYFTGQYLMLSIDLLAQMWMS